MINQPDVMQQEFSMLKNAPGYLIILIAMMISHAYASSLGETRQETINISADEAYEDVQPGILHFNGHFMMKSVEWELDSARATVYGQPDRPDKVLLEGFPARFRITRNDGEDQRTVIAEAAAMEYEQSNNLLQLTGGAVLMLNDEVIRSTAIKYDIETGRYWAGGVDGVVIEVPPVD
jgi:lipopolysaccharide transport protein LptA